LTVLAVFGWDGKTPALLAAALVLKKGGGVFVALSLARRVGDGDRATALAVSWTACAADCAALWMEDDAFEKRLSMEPRRPPEDGVPSRDMIAAAFWSWPQ